jgi:long-subunit fatty acid transport protein
MYDEGNLVSFGSVRKDFSVNGSAFGTSKSLIGDRSASNLSAKYQVNDNLALGLTAYDSGAIHINYQGAGGATSSYGPKVDLVSDSIAILSRYSFSESFSATAGVRYDEFKASNADIFGLSIYSATAAATSGTAIQKAQAGAAAADDRTPPSVSSDSDVVPIASVAFEKPEIALRAELVYQGKSSVSMQTTCGLSACATDQSTGGLAEYLTLNFQTGIAEDTLLFGSIHKGKWSASQLSVADNDASTPTSAFKDSTEYSLGLGRKFTDNVSGSISYNWEPEGSSTTTSLFTVNNGYKGVSLGVKYAVENFEIAAGYNYTKLGDVTYTGAPANNSLTDNTVSALGAKVTIRF